MHTVSIRTSILVISFICGYMFLIIRKTTLRQLDLFDLLMLSAVAVIPGAFTLFPRFAEWSAEITGVKFPFVVMFGALFAILFVFTHRLTIKANKLESENRLLTQELSLLKQTLESVKTAKR